MVSLIHPGDLLLKPKVSTADVSPVPRSVTSAGDLVKIRDQVYPGNCESTLKETTLESGSSTDVEEQQDMEGVEGELTNGDTKE